MCKWRSLPCVLCRGKRHCPGQAKMADVTRFRMWRLKDGYFLLESSKNSVPNAFSLSPWLNTNQSFVILRIKLYFARKTQSEIIESLAANSIMNATTIFKNCNHINLFYMHIAAKVFPLNAVIIFVFLSVYECSHRREFIHERATLSPYHRCGCNIFGARVSAVTADISLRDVFMTVTLLRSHSRCETLLLICCYWRASARTAAAHNGRTTKRVAK
jgi:hypothetical protein